MSARPAVQRGLRVLSGVAVLALATATVVGASRLPAPRSAADGPALVAVPASAATAVCPGPLIMPKASSNARFNPAPVPPATSVSVLSAPDEGTSGAGTVRALSSSAVLAPLSLDVPSAALTGTTGPVVVRAEPGSTGGARVAATAVGLVTDGDLRGLSAETCTAPTSDAWLVGGSTDLGRTAVLVLVNPGSTAAEVGVEAWGPNGRLDLAGGSQVVPPHGSRSVTLEAVAAAQRSIAVHVRATGGQVSAWVQDGAVRGFTPAGADLVVPGSAPAQRVTVPGLLVEASTVDSPGAPVLRLLAPGASGTRATVSLLGSDGPVTLPGAGTVDLAAGSVTDLPLGGLPAGQYTVVVEADQPVVAAAEYSRVGTPGALDTQPRVERAWAAAAPPAAGLVVPAPGTVDTLVVGAVPRSGDPTAQGSGAAASVTGTLRLLRSDGSVLDEHQVSVDAGTTAAWPLAKLVADPTQVAGVSLITTDGPVDASWALVAERAQADGTLVSLLLPAPEPAAAGRIAVRQDPHVGLG